MFIRVCLYLLELYLRQNLFSNDTNSCITYLFTLFWIHHSNFKIYNNTAFYEPAEPQIN